MSKPKILVQLDGDPQPSVFDSVVAIDSGVDQLLRHSGVQPAGVRDLVYGAIFTRGVDDLRQTAIFIGGSDVGRGEELLAAARKAFVGPMRVSVMLDSNGANTTASAAVLAAGKHVPVEGAEALVLAATGPVGSRVVRLLAAEGAAVRVGSRDLKRAQSACETIKARLPQAKLTPVQTRTPEEAAAALGNVQIVIAAGAPGVELLSAQARQNCATLKVAIDLSAVPPLGLAGVELTDRATDRDGAVCYGAIGVGGLKMKIHKAAVKQLFESNDQVLDAEEIYRIGQKL